MIDEPLSPQGMQRRDAILQLAKALADRRRARRLFSRSVAVAGLAVAGVVAALHWSVEVRPAEIKSIVAQTSSVPPSSVVITYVRTDPTISDRLALQPTPPRWTTVGDDELLNDLAAAGQPAGIVCMNGKTILLPR